MKPKLKHLKNLLYGIPFPVELIGSLAEPYQIENWKKPEWNDSLQYGRNLKALIEIKQLAEYFNLSLSELHEMGREIRFERLAVRRKMNQKHKVSGRDNKTVRIGSGGSNRNKIRYPKKCRKTAWKRFYKLFPNLKPE